MFTLEQQEYKKEKIDWQSISFTDNQICIDLIENAKTRSVFKLLDEECMMNGTEDKLLSKMHDQLQDIKHYGRAKKHARAFVIKHYAGEVTYSIDNFVEKNRDAPDDWITTIMGQSTKPVIREIFAMQTKQDNCLRGKSISN